MIDKPNKYLNGGKQQNGPCIMYMYNIPMCCKYEFEETILEWGGTRCFTGFHVKIPGQMRSGINQSCSSKSCYAVFFRFKYVGRCFWKKKVEFVQCVICGK